MKSTVVSISNFVKQHKYKLLVLMGAMLLLVLFLLKKRVVPVEGWSETVEVYSKQKEEDIAATDLFLSDNHSNFDRYKTLFSYFAQGYAHYKSSSGALIYYTGAVSSRGRKTNAVEGFARFFPLASAWISVGYDENILVDGNSINLTNLLKNGVLAGTDPAHPDYWGVMEDKDQRIAESADIALGLWLSKEKIWDSLTQSEKAQIIQWLQQALERKIVDNNWNLFPITVYKVMENLDFGNPEATQKINTQYNHYKGKHYLGSGWFDDPPKGIDYYNAWSIHYTLFWLDQIDPDFDPVFIHQSLGEFLSFYKYFFGENGFPIMGRSVCYRMAAPAPMLSGAILMPEKISPGLAFNAFDSTWRHFVDNGALEDGKVTQGIYQDDLGLVDSYTGAGSCLWSLRSFIIAIYANKFFPLWEAEQESLPVQMANFSVENPTIGWLVQGDKETGDITLHILANKEHENIPLKEYSFANKLKERFFERPFRPKNQDALYKNYSYSTKDLPYSNVDKK